MLRSSNDRLGIPQPTSQASGVLSPTAPTSHRSSILPPSSIRTPSRLQQPKSSSSSSPIPAAAVTATPTAPSTSIPGFRKISVSTPKAPTPLGLTTSVPQEDTSQVSPPSSISTTTTTTSTAATPVSTSGSAAAATTTTPTPTPGKTENVTVTVRIRPFSNSELKVAGGVTQVWEVNDGSNIVYNDDYAVNTRKAAVDYAYDHALTGSDNELIYNTSVKNLVQSAMEGYNGTVFAYGQTSSGKTYTMSGTETQPGITPRAVEDVFKYIRENSEREFLLRVSYMEIYNESIRDLLSPEAIDLRIHEDKRRGVYVSPLKEEIVTTPIQVMRIIERGDYQRHVSSTDFNAHSSRSHSIFQITVESRERSSAMSGSPTAWKPAGAKSASAVRVSQLNLIDLAGSEKASSDVERRKEGAFINKSLLTLGTVISKLTEEKGAHIPYRDSKLTRILQSSLNGSARVSVISTISPSYLNVEESNNTLKFAARVKKVVTRAQTNQVMDDKALLEKYRREISELKAQLMLTAEATARAPASGVNGSGVELDKAKQAELSRLLEKERLKHEEEMGEMNMVRNALKERIEHLTKLILTSSSINTKPADQPALAAGAQVAPSSITGGRGGTTVVETSADGTVLEFPKEIESRLAQKDTIVRQLQSELETQQEKFQMMRTVLERASRGEAVDLDKTLAKLEEIRPQEKFLIEKRASIMGLNTLVQSSSSGSLDGLAKMSCSGSGERLGMGENNEEDDLDLMDTPWNRSELQSLRQAKRELEIVVIDQEKKIEDLIALSSSYSRSTTPTPPQPPTAFEDSDEFRNLVLELEEQREHILSMDEEREGYKAALIEMRNRMRRMEMENQQLKASAQAKTNGSSNGLSNGSHETALSASELAAKIKDLDATAQKERRLRLEDQQRSMGRIASLEAELTMLKAEMSVRDLAGY
ncbi:hypothetical protein BG006_011070 [Podila minutissima]|uniref:Kinesin-like protein n=1 Tax=Podila minutissima TaxID=64525 RepID=A0A9P5SCH6_9FUNG|nr:hypothetical protein BG006_011070 [Podila minutissima]